MASYPAEIRAKIKELEAEINNLKKQANNGEIIDTEKVDKLQECSGYYRSRISDQVSYLVRCVCGGVEPTIRLHEGEKWKSQRIKSTSDLSKIEFELARNCADEILNILLKYAEIRASHLEPVLRKHE